MFNYCPKCTSKEIIFDGEKKFHCIECNWIFYQSVAAAVLCILTFEGKILLLTRAQDPKKGFLDLPGGFVNCNENAEKALERELYEELGIHISDFTYLGSAPNTYLYANVTYHVCDMIYFSPLKHIPTNFDYSEVEKIQLMDINEINESELAFPSGIEALKIFNGKILNKIIN